jgi:hypothetical protein
VKRVGDGQERAASEQQLAVDPLEVLWDPSARKQNMTDARYTKRPNR